MKSGILKILLLVIALAVQIQVLAQNNEENNTGNNQNTEEEKEEDLGERKIVVEGGFEPTLQDADKFLNNPKSEDSVFTAPEFEYKFNDVQLFTPFNITPIKPARMLGEPLDKLYSNYIALGAGTKATFYGEIFHNSKRSRDVKYGIHYKHLSAAGEIEDYPYPGSSVNTGDAYFTKLFKESALNVNSSYSRNVVHYYGFKKDDYLNDSLEDYQKKQVYNIFNANANFYRYKTKKDEWNYNLSFKYNLLTDYYENNESIYKLNGFMYFPTDFVSAFDNEKLGIENKSSIFNNNFDTSYSNTNALIKTKPFYKFDFELFEVNAGLLMDIVSDSLTEMSFYPAINVMLNAINEILIFNLNIDGGYKKHTYLNSVYENPFINPHNNYAFTEKKVGLKFGLFTSISSKLNFNLDVEYSEWKNEQFFVSDTTDYLMRKFTNVYDDYNFVEISSGISYIVNQNLQFVADGSYYIYSMENLLAAYHRPEFDISFSSIYNIQDKIIIDAKLKAYGKSNNLIYDMGKPVVEEIPFWLDASINLEYRYSKRLGFFAKFNNIANMKYQRYYNYPVYGFNAMGGLSYIF